MQFLKRFFTEYLVLNLFIWGCMAVLSLLLFNISIFDPFTQAFRDFSLTDLYYSKIRKQDNIYKGPVVLVNIENRSRKEIAFLLHRIQEGHPKTVGLDIVFSGRKNEDDNLLRDEFKNKSNYVFGFMADFENPNESHFTDSFFTTGKSSFVNLVGTDRSSSTIRYYHPFYQKENAFTTSLLKQYDEGICNRLLPNDEGPMEIHYYGGLENFKYYHFDEVLQTDFDLTVFQNKIVIVGYLGLPDRSESEQVDEDKFFTPLNSHLSGRSFPDMYGSVIHANILRMILEKDCILVVSPEKTVIITFCLTWIYLPLVCFLFFKGDLWFNSIGTGIQFAGSILTVWISLLLYQNNNIKFDPGLLTACIVLIPTFLNLYEVGLKLLRYQLRLDFDSRFLKKSDND